jgi:pimeloyl-ACP methyl ester carboxylesterase
MQTTTKFTSSISIAKSKMVDKQSSSLLKKINSITQNQPNYIIRLYKEGKEMAYLSWHYRNLAFNPAAITQADINEYVSHYSAPGGMRAGFEHYRAIPQDAIQNQNYSKTKLTMPVLALAGGYVPTFGGNITMPAVIYGMKLLAQNVTGITVPNSGHYIAEEQPDVVVKLLNNFFGGNSNTKASK